MAKAKVVESDGSMWIVGAIVMLGAVLVVILLVRPDVEASYHQTIPCATCLRRTLNYEQPFYVDGILHKNGDYVDNTYGATVDTPERVVDGAAPLFVGNDFHASDYLSSDDSAAAGSFVGAPYHKASPDPSALNIALTQSPDYAGDSYSKSPEFIDDAYAKTGPPVLLPFTG